MAAGRAIPAATMPGKPVAVDTPASAAWSPTATIRRPRQLQYPAAVAKSDEFSLVGDRAPEVATAAFGIVQRERRPNPLSSAWLSPIATSCK